METAILVLGSLIIGCTFFLHVGAANRQANSLTSEQVKTLLDNQKNSLKDSINSKKKIRHPVHFDVLLEEYLKQMETEAAFTDNDELYQVLKWVAIYRVGEQRFCETEELIDGPTRGLKMVRHHLWILPATK